MPILHSNVSNAILVWKEKKVSLILKKLVDFCLFSHAFIIHRCARSCSSKFYCISISTYWNWPSIFYHGNYIIRQQDILALQNTNNIWDFWLNKIKLHAVYLWLHPKWKHICPQIKSSIFQTVNFKNYNLQNHSAPTFSITNPILNAF